MHNYEISSVTGVDLKLSLAGPGARSYAFLLDWHIRLLLALAWFVVGSFVANGTLAYVADEGVNQSTYLGWVVTPALVIYFGYHPLLELMMRGRSPGKRMAGLRVVTLDGEIPGALSIVIRNVLRIVDSMPVGYMFGLVTTILTQKSVRIGDLAAGTIMIYDVNNHAQDEQQPLAPDAVERFGLRHVELGTDLLDRWDDLSPAKRQGLATRMIIQLGGTVDVKHDEGLRAQLQVMLQPTGPAH